MSKFKKVSYTLALVALYLVLLLAIAGFVYACGQHPLGLVFGIAIGPVLYAMGHLLSDRDYAAWIDQLRNPSAFYTTSDPRPFNHL